MGICNETAYWRGPWARVRSLLQFLGRALENPQNKKPKNRMTHLLVNRRFGLSACGRTVGAGLCAACTIFYKWHLGLAR